MAVKELTPNKGEVNRVTPFVMETASAAGDGFQFVMPKTTEEYVVIVAHNTGGDQATLTLKCPEKGHYAAATSDEEVVVQAGEYAQIRIESARYADIKGVVKVAASTADVKVAVLY